ncbi:PIG-L family deacetylase [Cellulomonas sp. NPDC089187]|uniref:PIG-L family deacetylase n=1 Tax=Cellulomonas sp. NPDC089187 TaxID=3154970 RepID=UPI0034424A88
MAVHAHPDDETLTSGVLLSTAVAADLPTTVITCTRGEQGEVIGPLRAELEGNGPALGAYRETEIAAAMRALGGVEQRFLDQLPGPAVRYVDSGMAWMDGFAQAGAAAELPADALVAGDLDAQAGRLAAWLGERRPALVVTYEPGGGYGHPDHVRTHRIVRRAAELMGVAAPPVAWAVALGADLHAAYRVLADDADVAALIAAHADLAWASSRQGPFTLPDPAGSLPAMARTRPGAGFIVPVWPVRGAVLDALGAHATQVQAVTALERRPALAGCYALSNGVLAPILPEERYEWADPSRTVDLPWAVPSQPDPVA